MVLYEINTWVWLNALSQKYKRQVRLDTVPESVWQELGALQVDAIWLMGVWRRSTEARRISASHADFQAELRGVLPDFSPEDVSGSPYSVQEYVVDEHLGGQGALAAARQELRKRGLKLLLDFVPNHVAPDHSWIHEHPDYMVQAVAGTVNPDQGKFFEKDGRWFAYGRDPNLAGWPDTAQLNAFAPELRRAAAETLTAIAAQCDGVRCDMAMLLLNDVFERTWGPLAGPRPATEYWTDLTATVRGSYRDFILIAEVYWDLEYRLQQLGFDYCYDKRLYDRLCYGDPDGLRAHLGADTTYQDKLIRFLENHDEARAAAVMDDAKERAAATIVASLPGAQLYFDGQFTGERVKLSVHLGRKPAETPNEELKGFYLRLLTIAAEIRSQSLAWQLCPCEAAEDESYRNILAWTWSGPGQHYLIAVNYSNQPARARLCGGVVTELKAWVAQICDLGGERNTILFVSKTA